MELIHIYEDYLALDKGYTPFIEKLVETDFNETKEVIQKKLKETKEQIEVLMKRSEAIEIDELNEHNLKDLRYLLMNLLFLATELEGFYESQELGRFKMRAINFLNKKKRDELTL